MKKIVAFVLALVMGMSFSTAAFATNSHGTSAAKLSAAELKIGKAYLKTLETFDAKYINAVKYPGVTFESGTLDEGVIVKVLNPIFSKAKDTTLKLDRVDISGLLIVSNTEKVVLAQITEGMAMKMKGKKLYAYEEVDTSMEYVKAIGEMDEKLLSGVTKYLTDLYGADTAKTLLDGYVDPSEQEETPDDGSETPDPTSDPAPTPGA